MALVNTSHIGHSTRWGLCRLTNQHSSATKQRYSKLGTIDSTPFRIVQEKSEYWAKNGRANCISRSANVIPNRAGTERPRTEVETSAQHRSSSYAVVDSIPSPHVCRIPILRPPMSGSYGHNKGVRYLQCGQGMVPTARTLTCAA